MRSVGWRRLSARQISACVPARFSGLLADGSSSTFTSGLAPAASRVTMSCAAAGLGGAVGPAPA
eukprot:435765-Alexandrium_andersonii.AAC.1